MLDVNRTAASKVCGHTLDWVKGYSVESVEQMLSKEGQFDYGIEMGFKDGHSLTLTWDASVDPGDYGLIVSNDSMGRFVGTDCSIFDISNAAGWEMCIGATLESVRFYGLLNSLSLMTPLRIDFLFSSGMVASVYSMLKSEIGSQDYWGVDSVFVDVHPEGEVGRIKWPFGGDKDIVEILVGVD